MGRGPSRQIAKVARIGARNSGNMYGPFPDLQGQRQLQYAVKPV